MRMVAPRTLEATWRALVDGNVERLQESPALQVPVSVGERDVDDLRRLVATVEVSYLVAAADGEVSATEARHVARSLCLTRPPRELVEALFRGYAAALAREGIRRRLEAVAGALVEPDLRRLALVLAAGVASVDGRVVPAEARACAVVAQAFDLDDEHGPILAEAARLAVSEIES